MKKFMVVSGFLGAGKTTCMIALAEYIHNARLGKVCLIANDLGAKNLIDAKFSADCGCDTTELAGECICYQTENMVDRLRRLFDHEGYDLVISDIPGCGVGALEHVYHKLNDDYHGEFELAPLLVVVDPGRLRAIMPEQADLNLPREITYLLEAQLGEADAVALNKIDLLSEAEITDCLAFLEHFRPDTDVFAVSGKERTNIEALGDHVLSHGAGLKKVAVGSCDPEFFAAEEKLSWYNRQLFVKICCGTFDGNAFLGDFVEAIRAGLVAHARNVPHLKVYGRGEDGTACKISLLGVECEAQFDRRLDAPCPDLPVIINARAACESPLLAEIVDKAQAEAARKHNLDCYVFFTECFGMMDEGRLD